MSYIKIGKHDYREFHALANFYYREGEDENTPQEVIDSFIRMMFDKVINNEIDGCFVKHEQEFIGFALWAIDAEIHAFCKILFLSLGQKSKIFATSLAEGGFGAVHNR